MAQSTRPTDDTEDTEDHTVPEEFEEQTAHDAQYVGTDADGDQHFWSIYEQTAYVLKNGQMWEIPMKNLPGCTLGDHMVYVSRTLGEWKDSRVAAETPFETIAKSPDPHTNMR